MDTPDQLTASDEVKRLQAEISETQAQLQHTVAEIRDRLSAGHLRKQARAATVGRMKQMKDRVRNNPMPYALIGAGVGAALLLGLNRARQRRATRPYMSDEYGSRTPLETAGEREAARERVRRAASRARSGWDHMVHDNPMVLGLVALAAGALLGASLPPTELENQYLGETRDKVLESARSMAEKKAQEFATGY